MYMAMIKTQTWLGAGAQGPGSWILNTVKMWLILMFQSPQFEL